MDYCFNQQSSQISKHCGHKYVSSSSIQRTPGYQSCMSCLLSTEKRSAQLYFWGDWLCQLGGKKTYHGVISAQAGFIIYTQPRSQHIFYLLGYHKRNRCVRWMSSWRTACMSVFQRSTAALYLRVLYVTAGKLPWRKIVCVCVCVWLCMLCSNTKVSRQICDPAEALSSSGTSQLHVKGTHRKRWNNKCTNILLVHSATANFFLCFPVFCSFGTMLPLCIPIVSWIIDECLSSVLSMVNQSPLGCPLSASPRFNKSFRASWKQVLYCRLSSGTNSTQNQPWHHQLPSSPPSSPSQVLALVLKRGKTLNLMCNDDTESSGFAVRTGSFGMIWKLLQESSLVPYPWKCSFASFSLLSIPSPRYISTSADLLWVLALVSTPCAQSSLHALHSLSCCLWALHTH